MVSIKLPPWANLLSTDLQRSHLLLRLLGLRVGGGGGVELEEVGEQFAQLLLLHRFRQARGHEPLQTALLSARDGDTCIRGWRVTELL